MSTLETPPELADFGYWYVLPVVPDPELGGQTPGEVPGVGWCAWYGNGLVAIRCPDPVSGLQSLPDRVASVITGTKPYGRIGGR